MKQNFQQIKEAFLIAKHMFIIEVSKAYLKLKRIYLMPKSVCSVSCKTFNLQKIHIKLAFSHKQISFPNQESCYSK